MKTMIPHSSALPNDEALLMPNKFDNDATSMKSSSHFRQTKFRSAVHGILFLVRKLTINKNENEAQVEAQFVYCKKCNKKLFYQTGESPDLAGCNNLNEANTCETKLRNDTELDQIAALNDNEEIRPKKRDFTSSILVGDLNETQTDSNNKSNYNNDNFKTNKVQKETDKTENETVNSSNNNNFYQNQPFKCLSSTIEPKFLLAIIQERLESHKKIDINASTMGANTNSTSGLPLTNVFLQSSASMTGANLANSIGLSTSNASTTNNKNRVKCTASARTINCQHHCVAILATRLFALLCNEQSFQQRLMSENQEACFNMIIDILYPNNDPVNINSKQFYLILIKRNEVLLKINHS